MPHVYQTDNFYNASAAKEDEEEKKEMTVLKDAIASFETKLADLKASSFKNAEQPERKTIPAVMSNLLAKANIQPDSNGKFDKDALDAALDKVPGVSRLQAMALKTELRASGQFN